MNREQRREIEKKAKKVWDWEKTLNESSFPDVQQRAIKEIKKIMNSCTDEELFLIDEYITNHCAVKS